MTTPKPSQPSPWAQMQLGSKLLLLAALIVIPVAILPVLVWSAVPDDQSTVRAWAGVLAVLAVAGVILMLQTVLGGLLNRMAQLAAAVRNLGEGNLAAEMKFIEGDELGRLGRQVDRLSANLSIIVANVRNNASVVAQTGGNLAQASSELSERTSHQAAALEQTAASIHEITETVNRNAHSALRVDRLAGGVRSSVENGEQAMRVAVETIHGIQASSNRMGEIVAVIDSIAFQTNILALNAAVEAARAGEQGKSFAVVASEVSTLAQRSAQAAREIKVLITGSSAQIGAGVKHVHAVADSLKSILGGVQEVATQVSGISAATSEQSKGLNRIAKAIAELDSITQHNAELVDQSAEAAAELSERAARIAKSVGRFRLRQGSAEESMALVHRVLDHAARYGVQAAIDAVNDPKQRFFDRDMYVFIGDANSTFLACAGRPERIGTNMLNAPGIDGRKIHAMTVECANNGGGWIEYEIHNPVTGKTEPKMSYIKRLGHDMNIGCGVYRTELMSVDS